MTRHTHSTGRTLLKVIAATTAALALIPAGIARAQAGGAQVVQGAQAGAKQKKDAADKAEKAKLKATAAFYDKNDEPPLAVTLTTNIKKIRGDKGDTGPWRDATLSYVNDGKPVVIPIKIKTRGIWRKKNCEFPPVRLNIARATSNGTVFFGLDRPKLVSYCRDDEMYEQYVLQEFQLYRIYTKLTPMSHRARLVKMTYADEGGKVQATRAAIILEEPDVMAKRLELSLVKEKGAGPDFMEPHHGALVGVFEYFIGNTDFSIFALHNIELLSQPDGNVIPVPMDFDFSGVVNARYATPDPKVNIARVRERIFRGYCVPAEEFTKVFEQFRQGKEPIYALYQDEIGKLMRKDYVESTLKYYDDFYKNINNPRDANREIIKSCITGR
jgi:hypothetical protein